MDWRLRCGLALKHGITCLNTPGTIDADYRGEIGVILINLGYEPFTIHRGDRIAQLVFQQVARVELVEVEELPPSGRGAGGFGSTGGAGGSSSVTWRSFTWYGSSLDSRLAWSSKQ